MTQPRRSVLFMPGSNPRALEKAKSLKADSLVFDLEDAVDPTAKAAAREMVVSTLQDPAFARRECVVRINGTDTVWWKHDVAAMAKAGARRLLIPKVESASTLHAVADHFATCGGPKKLSLWAMIETPRGVLEAARIAEGHANLEVLAVGANDLTKEMRAKRVPGRAPILAALSMTVLAARANGLMVLDSVYNDFKDAEGFLAEAKQALEMGFDGKTLIHPSQIEAANSVFAPSAADVVAAELLINAFDAAQKSGKGVAVLDGRMIEELHVVEARRILAFAARVEAS